MNQLSIINPILIKKIRNHVPVTRLAVSDQGSVMLAVPDAYQTRLYRLVCMSPSGDYTEMGTFSVEKTSHADLSADGRTFIAATVDDVYVFHDWRKARFFAHSRANYLDVSISASGEFLAVGLADMIASTHAIVLARNAGAHIWMKSLPYNITCVCISEDASCILVGSDEGTAVMLDAARKVAWELEGDDPLISIAVSPTGERSVLCSRSGVVREIGREGNRLWEVGDAGVITSCCISGDGETVMVARTEQDESGVLEIYASNGTLVLEYRTDYKINSIACSRNGRFVAVSCEDGTFRVLEVTRSVSGTSHAGRIDLLRSEGDASLESGDLASAVRKFTELLDLSPCDLEVCRKLIKARETFVRECFTNAERLAADGNVEKAGGQIRSALDMSPCDPDLLREFADLRGKIVSDALDASSSLTNAGSLEEAAEKVRQVLKVDAANIEARKILSDLQKSLVARYLRDAQSALEREDPSEAVELLGKAVVLQPTSEIEDLLAKAHSCESMRDGLLLYGEKRYSEALIHFRKALLFDSGNSDAAKYIEYAENLRQDDVLFDRFSKLE